LKCQHTQNLDRVAQDATKAVTHRDGSSVRKQVVQSARDIGMSHIMLTSLIEMFIVALEQTKNSGKDDMIHFLSHCCYREYAYKFGET
jgi:hypothetical protein